MKARLFIVALLLAAFGFSSNARGRENAIEADLLIVGGTESGCAAAIQAARMGVERIVLVNDIEWLGGQFSAEGLGAIDENRAAGYDGSVPIPRSGLFRDVIDAIEKRNAQRYGGVRRPGNTRVITTCRPVMAEQVFRDLLAPFEKRGQLRRFSNLHVETVLTENNRVIGVKFGSSTQPAKSLVVRARLTIDASDWGDVIQGSGAKWEAGIDAQAKYGEPSAPATNQPATDMNPITWCMILEQRKQKTIFPKPAEYDARYFNGQWGWIDEKFAYTTRRLVDGQGFQEIDHPDVLLINSPPTDYPLDTYPANVAAELERLSPGASKKNIVAMSPQERAIVFRDARRHTLKYYYHLQQRFPKFHFMELSEEFGTADKLPPKPYIRESLRLHALHVVREQEVLGFGSRSNYAATMFPDAVMSWQFEMDFHPTQRSWTSEQQSDGPWQATFRGNRRFHRGGTGRSVLPLRSLVPRDVKGLLAAQKNLGYSSIVGSSCRLHDQSIHVGQASGAVAAVCLRHQEDANDYYLRRKRMAEIWTGLLDVQSGAPLAIWPFADVDPFDEGFAAIQQLALRRLFPLDAEDTRFAPQQTATASWIADLLKSVRDAGYGEHSLAVGPGPVTRREIASRVWRILKARPEIEWKRQKPHDADGDGKRDSDDPLPFTPGVVSWKLSPHRDGLPELKPPFGKLVRAFNFTSAKSRKVEGFSPDVGGKFNEQRGYGWQSEITQNTRLRHKDNHPLRDGFVFTRQQDVWECKLPSGNYRVSVCIGDAAHEQPGQHLQIEGRKAVDNVSTSAGQFHEATVVVRVRDGRLTITLGVPQGGSNTCVNWLIVQPAD